MRFEASYHARRAGEVLRTVGVMIRGPRLVRFWAMSYPGSSLEAEVNAQLAASEREVGPAEAFDRMVESANGVTREWSTPFLVDASSPEEAARDLLFAAQTG